MRERDELVKGLKEKGRESTREEGMEVGKKCAENVWLKSGEWEREMKRRKE